MLPPFMHTNIELKGREWIKVAQHPLSNNCWYLPNYTSSKKKIYTILRYRISINQIGNDLSILTQFQKYFLKTIAPPLFVFIFIYCALLLYSVVFFLNILCFNQSFKTRTGGSTWDQADPGLEPVRVKAKTCLGIGPKKLSRPGTRSTWSTRVRPVNFFFILIVIKWRRFDILKGQNAEEWRRTKQYQLQFTNLINSTLWNQLRSRGRLDY